ncbi:hypothetical protein D1BOALGB6SA_9750 [Olavius sp. associated proteobacterium Delta 1]|nr:hypothetical protein D1BOALGB6SA_9750 [Olavius sp. associated proteobacterium Delta 1]
MQIHNFYSDPVPSVRNPLDSIVLSPHTIRAHHISLTDMDEDSSDYQSLLPSIRSCEFHGQDTGLAANSLPRYIWDRCRHLIRICRT